MKPILLILLHALLSACTTLTLNAPPLPLGDGISLNLPQPKDVLPPLSAVQLLTASFGAQTLSHEVILQNSDNVLSVVGVGPLGNITYSLSYDGREIKGIDLPANIKADHLKYAVGDIVIVFSNSNSLLKSLPNDAKLLDSPLHRELWLNQKKVLEVDYENLDHWTGTVKYKNFLRSYELVIKNLKVEKQK